LEKSLGKITWKKPLGKVNLEKWQTQVVWGIGPCNRKRSRRAVFFPAIAVASLLKKP
jgi:hypothetical protein